MAIKIFEIKVNLKMIFLNMLEFTAVLNLLFMKIELEAKMFEKEYFSRGINQYGNYYYVIRANLLFSSENKTKKVKGITLVSKTEKGIENLENLINYVYRNKKSEYLKLLSEIAERVGLIIGDFSFDKNTNKSYYSSTYRYIFLKEELIDERERAFYHETTHFLDNIRITDRNELKFF